MNYMKEIGRMTKKVVMVFIHLLMVLNAMVFGCTIKWKDMVLYFIRMATLNIKEIERVVNLKAKAFCIIQMVQNMTDEW
jgi:hypothetical protein